MKNFGLGKFVLSVSILGGLTGFSLSAGAAELPAQPASKPMTIDGDAGDWAGVSGITVPLKGNGGVDKVEMKAVVHGDRIYILAQWEDATESRLHKPYQWDEASASYKRTKQLEDRLAISLVMSGDFSASKLSGAEFTADVWHWKASRSDPAGVAHDKWWKVSQTEFPKSKKFKAEDGQTVYLARPSDSGDRLYKPVKYKTKEQDLMPRYDVNTSPAGSIADISAKGIWNDGRWTLEFSRKLSTGNEDDAEIPASGTISMAVAAFNDVDGKRHSTSEMLTLRTSGVGN